MSDFDKAREDYDIFQYCWDNGHQEWLQTFARTNAYARLQQWSDKDRARLESVGRPALTISKFNAIFNAISGRQLELRSDVRFTPLQTTTDQQAMAMDKTYLFIAQQNNLDWVESSVFDSGALGGRGFYDTRVEFDDKWMGHAVIRPLNPAQVVLDPDNLEYDPKNWSQVFTTEWPTLLEIEASYGRDAANDLKHNPTVDYMSYEDITRARTGTIVRDPIDRPDSELRRVYRLINRQYFVSAVKEMFLDMQTGDMSEIPETWDRERIQRVLQAAPEVTTVKRRVRTIKWRVSCNGLILHDDYSPYDYFTVTPYFPYFFNGAPMGHMEQIIDMQNLFNKVLSQQLHILNSSANSGWKIKAGSLHGKTIEEIEEQGAMTGLVLELDDVTDAEKIVPNPVPTGHDRFGDSIGMMMDNVAGVPAQVRGFTREDVASKALQQNIAQAGGNLAKMFDNLYLSKKLLARNIVSCVKAYYTEERLLAITGGVAGQQVDRITINQPTPEGQLLNDMSVGEYAMTIVPSKARTTLDETEFAQIIQLRELGVPIPDAALIEASPLTRKQEIMQNMQQDSAEQAQRQQAIEEAIAQQQMAVSRADERAKNASAELSMARANKANREAQDGDDKYIAMEQERIDAERERDEANRQLQILKMQQDDVKDQRKTALDITKMRHDASENDKDRANDRATAKKQEKSSGKK